MDGTFWRQYFTSLSPDEARDAYIAARADRVATYFTSNPRLKYLGVTGIGRHGGALLFQEQDTNDEFLRKIVIKYSLDETADEDLQNEAVWLEQLRGAEHIAQIIPLAEAELDVSGTGKRPTLALEFIPYGSFHAFQLRLAKAGIHSLPNRFLWRILLCLTRQVIAMAYPPRGGPLEPITRERIKPDEEPYALTQNSSHLANLMVGELTKGDAEHGFTPSFILIDFGRGEVESDVSRALESNIWAIGYMFMCIAAPDLPYKEIGQGFRENRNEYILAEPIGEITTVVTQAHPLSLEKEYLDPSLKDLMARCLASDREHRPSLEELLERCEHALVKRLPTDSFGETNFAIYRLVQEFFLNADVVEAPGNKRMSL
ncbi:hypothetical protein M426DRAFT_27930 [Hypoxylon sp. CI-4A]|nr:hypothetical protein M426DRAFT_27930 [Hypoxylon sp. CI-4A]